MKLYEVIDREYQLYVDLDGVLADFEGGFFDAYGVNTNAYTDNDMWPMVYKIPNFFYKLDFIPSGQRLWSVIKKYKPIILTGLPSSKPVGKVSNEDQKKLWVKEKLGPYVPCIVLPSKDKQLHAKPHHILIDDRTKNIEQWRAAGGIGIQHTESDLQATLKQLRSLGIK